jgi:cobalt/nickel transport protein
VKKFLAMVALLLVFLALFIPFASSNPDGLEKVAASLGVEESAPFWKGLLSGYSVEAFKNPYVSTLVAGVLGVLLVLVASLMLGLLISKKVEPVKSVCDEVLEN